MNPAMAAAPTAKYIEQQVQAIEQVCIERSVRMTAMRREVYRALVASASPLTAYDLMDQLSERLGRRLAPPTVYRALEFLLDQALIHRLESTNAYLPCNHPGTEHDSVYLLCQECGVTQELTDERVGLMIFEQANERGFNPVRQVIEVQGICAECAPPL